MIVLCCGSRDWTDIHAIRKRLVTLPPDTWILHGAAPGADSIAASLADNLGFDVRGFPANWQKHGNAAGPLRNLRMLDQKPDLVIAFRSPGSSPGTDHTVREARKRGIPVEVHHGPGRRPA